MFRKSFLFISIISLATLVAWGFAPASTTPVSASATATTNNCQLQVSVNPPSLTGTTTSPKTVGVTWQVTNVPPCYRVEGAEVTFTINQNNGNTITKVVNVTSGSVNGAIANLNLGENLPAPQRPNAIIANVKVKAVAIDPIKQRAESNTKTL